MERLDQIALFNLAIQLDLPELLNFCASNKKFNRLICQNKEIWLYKLKKEYSIEETLNPRYFYEFLKRSETNIEKYITLALQKKFPEEIIKTLFKKLLFNRYYSMRMYKYNIYLNVSSRNGNIEDFETYIEEKSAKSYFLSIAEGFDFPITKDVFKSNFILLRKPSNHKAEFSEDILIYYKK